MSIFIQSCAISFDIKLSKFKRHRDVHVHECELLELCEDGKESQSYKSMELKELT